MSSARPCAPGGSTWGCSCTAAVATRTRCCSRFGARVTAGSRACRCRPAGPDRAVDAVPARPDALAGGRRAGRGRAGAPASAAGGHLPRPRRGGRGSGRGGWCICWSPSFEATTCAGACRLEIGSASWAPPSTPAVRASCCWVAPGYSGLVDEIRAGLGPAAGRAVDLSSRLWLGGLVGVLERADLFVGNDSGPRHLAEAVGTATVGVFTRANLVDVAPLFRARHRVLVSWASRAQVCGAEVPPPPRACTTPACWVTSRSTTCSHPSWSCWASRSASPWRFSARPGPDHTLLLWRAVPLICRTRLSGGRRPLPGRARRRARPPADPGPGAGTSPSSTRSR